MTIDNKNTLILISGTGIGAGKTTLAKTLGITVSLADGIRSMLSKEYPNVDWYDRSQKYKETFHTAINNTPRNVLKSYGRLKILAEGTHIWCKVAQPFILQHIGNTPVSIDDIRRTDEVKYFREEFKNVLHLHIAHDKAEIELEFDSEKLASLADYIVSWTKSEVL